MDLPAAAPTSTPPAHKAWIKYKRIAQTYLDKTVIFPAQRWVFFAISLLMLYGEEIHLWVFNCVDFLHLPSFFDYLASITPPCNNYYTPEF
ncbi:unnamed protein product [Amoebophrya sp. A25]|nr:unnamed protein product [Amoebophrya sp. A25]|eukprot:GSA25T00022682001.1